MYMEIKKIGIKEVELYRFKRLLIENIFLWKILMENDAVIGKKVVLLIIFCKVLYGMILLTALHQHDLFRV